MSDQKIQAEIFRVSKEALELIKQISFIWDEYITEYVQSDLQKVA